MAGVDYYGIEEELLNILMADSTLTGVQVAIEDSINLDTGPWVVIYLLRRSPTSSQPIAAGKRLRYRLELSLWCWQYSLESMKEACNMRDDLISKVELVLLKNRTIGDKVAFSYPRGGELLTDRIPETSGYAAGGEIILDAEVTAIAD